MNNADMMDTQTSKKPEQFESGGPIQVFYQGRRPGNHVVVDRAVGVYLWDTSGKRYFDGSSGPVLSNIGHNNPHVRSAMIAQFDRCTFATRSVFSSEAENRLAELLTRLAGPGFDQAYPVSGGSEGVEAALKLARQYAVVSGDSKRYKVLSRDPSYHGATLGAQAVTGDPVRAKVFGPMMRIMPQIATPWTYRIPAGFDANSYAQYCVEDLENTIRREGPESVLAFIMEPVGGVSTGAVRAPDSYYRGIRDVCTRHGVLLIYDEVMTGAARTGHFLAAHFWPDAAPDIIVMAKGIGAGYTPLGAVLAPNRIVDAIAEDGGFLHGYTSAGNPLSCAIGVAVVEEIERLGLAENTRRMAALLRERMSDVMTRSTVIGDFRGLGLLNAIEVVEDKETKRPFPGAGAVGRIVELGCQNGLLLYARKTGSSGLGEWLMVAPPLIVNEAQIDELVELIEKTFLAFEREIGRTGVR